MARLQAQEKQKTGGGLDGKQTGMFTVTVTGVALRDKETSQPALAASDC